MFQLLGLRAVLIYEGIRKVRSMAYIRIKGEVGAVKLVKALQFKPSIFLLTVPRRYFFCGSFMFFLSCDVMPLCTSVYLYLVATYWERAGLLALVFGVSL